MLLGTLTEPCASVVSIAVLIGMRIGEILALRWKRIDLLGATIEVADNYSSGEFGPPKTKSSRRAIPISSALRRVLEAQRARANPITPEELVFQTPKGTPLSDKNLYNRELAPVCDRIGQPRISWHSFRHTHATLLHANGDGSRGTRSGTPTRRFCMRMANLSRPLKLCSGIRISRRRSTCTPTLFPTRRGTQ